MYGMYSAIKYTGTDCRLRLSKHFDFRGTDSIFSIEDLRTLIMGNYLIELSVRDIIDYFTVSVSNHMTKFLNST
jgi:hypothetical protein